jgi:heme-degrading monooxygenase HmoA
MLRDREHDQGRTSNAGRRDRGGSAVSASGPVVSVLTLHVRAGSEPALVRSYEELEIFRQAQESGGFRSGRLLEPSGPDEPMLVIAEWDDSESYERWLASPVRERLGRELEPLLADEPAAGRIYREAAAGPQRAPTAP